MYTFTGHQLYALVGCALQTPPSQPLPSRLLHPQTGTVSPTPSTAHAHHPSTQEAEAGGLGVHSYSGLRIILTQKAKPEDKQRKNWGKRKRRKWVKEALQSLDLCAQKGLSEATTAVQRPCGSALLQGLRLITEFRASHWATPVPTEANLV